MLTAFKTGHKEEAIKLLTIVPDHLGKKKMLGRQLREYFL